MSMRLFRILIFGLFTALTCSAQTASRPNVLVIVADDLGWAGVGFHNKAMVTPNLDRLAKEGAELQRFYSAFRDLLVARTVAASAGSTIEGADAANAQAAAAGTTPTLTINSIGGTLFTLE